ncbi:hypothetical protein [Mesobacterium pallidum]|uniref:hypothetical protein n=1 Tax=Mesobacterium pallidum TaxID=2872037 RepID=UPI001EE2C76C|nr:hypothetical protein [Mesobacterium pallidum]
MLTIPLSGPLLIACDGAHLSGVSRRAQAMLAFLAAQPAMRADRARLADLLWSDRGPEQARASLRQELSVMRKCLPEGTLEADRQWVWLDGAQVEVTRGAGVPLDGFDLASEGFEDWLRDLRSAASDVVAAVALAPAATGPRTGRPALAVMPFDNLNAEPDDMFADGVVEEITSALSHVQDFDVIARQSAFALRGQALDVPSVAKRLGADYVVEGTVRRAGDRVRITVQLVRGKDGHAVWSERFDDRLDDLFDLQDRIAARVAGQMSPGLRQVEILRARTAPPADRSAYDLVLTALPHFWAHRKKENARAIELLDAALARDPDYGPALAYKAWALAQQPSYIWSTDPAADRAQALDLADMAERRTTDHAPSLVAISAAVSLVSDQTDRARNAVDRALALDPNNAWGWMRLGWVSIYQRQPEEALDHLARAGELSPLDPFRFNMTIGRAVALAQTSDLTDAIDLIRKGILQAPGIKWANRLLASWLIQVGRETEARAAMQELMTAYPGLTLDFLIASVPPTLVEQNRRHYAALLSMGLPES